MRRVVVTGIGVVSSIGNNANDVLASLREAKSGISAAPEYAELGFRSQVQAAPQIDWESMIDRRALRFLAQGTGFAHIAMEQAIADSGLEEAEVSHERTGLIVGSGGPSTMARVEGPPEPTIRPVRSWETSASSSPESAIACSMAMCAKPVPWARNRRARRSIIDSQSIWGAACTWLRKPSSAYSGAAEIPDFASRNEARTSFALLPIEETTPIPVTTTRRMLQLSCWPL